MISDNSPVRWTKDGEGFTLIETIIALVILSIGILAVATLSSTSIWQVRRGQDLTNSALAAQQVMEELMGLPYDSVNEGKYADTVTMGGVDYTVVWTVEDQTDSLASRGAEYKFITVYSQGGVSQTRAETYEMGIFRLGGSS